MFQKILLPTDGSRHSGEAATRLLVNETLLDLRPGTVGTSTDEDKVFGVLFRCKRVLGEYDTILKHLVQIAFRYRDLLQPRVYEHLVGTLLSVRGRHDPDVECKSVDCDWSSPLIYMVSPLWPFTLAVDVFGVTTEIDLPESENHLFMRDSVHREPN